ncbi:MAG TPA: SPFH domain-containing protein [Gemmataceae bacterium]|nr:SPFH domain-containing protein [Gemmataceae bacterium]
MEFWNKPRTWLVFGVIVAAVLLLQQLWHWEVERQEVPPNQLLVRVHLWGENLDPDEIIALDSDHKGVMLDVLPEGRHFLNPLIWSSEIHPARIVPPGKCLVLTRKYGKKISPERLARGEFLAGPDERGIVPEVKLPGKHYINPYAYDVTEQDALEIHHYQVGVRTLLWGKDARDLKGASRSAYVVPEGYRGVQEKPVPPGTYYLNPYREKIVPVDTRSHRVEFKDIRFPSLDGFHLNPHVLVVYRVLPEKAPELLVMLSTEAQLHQADSTEKEQQDNEILQKVILPLIRGYGRIEGSKYNARDFISQVNSPRQAKAVNPRERLQHELMDKVTPICKDLGIAIEAITLADMDTSNEELKKLAAVISQREVTRVTREKFQQQIEQYKTEQAQKAAEALKEQKEKTVEAETKRKVEVTNAQKMKEVEEKKLEQELKAAQVRLEAARDRVKATLSKGKAEAAVINAQNEAEVSGLRTAVQGFPSADSFAQYQIIARIAPALTEIFTSDNSDLARLFASYLAPGPKMPRASKPVNGEQPAVAEKPGDK